MMINLRKIIIDHFVDELRRAYQQTYNLMEPQFANIIEWSGRLALENISNADTLYHNMEHTIMVTLVGQSILRGKHLAEGGVRPLDWLHTTMAMLFHDIGYVKGVCSQDTDVEFATGIDGKTVHIPLSGTGASLAPYHVDRAKLFVRERFEEAMVDVVPEQIAAYIEMTRFPKPQANGTRDPKWFGNLVRASDFIGQLGDPDYLRKMPALFYEFEEIGENERIGYTSPEDMRRNYTKFYWDVVRPHIGQALTYLRLTQEGKQWVANLHSHVFDIEHGHTGDGKAV